MTIDSRELYARLDEVTGDYVIYRRVPGTATAKYLAAVPRFRVLDAAERYKAPMELSAIWVFMDSQDTRVRAGREQALLERDDTSHLAWM